MKGSILTLVSTLSTAVAAPLSLQRGPGHLSIPVTKRQANQFNTSIARKYKRDLASNTNPELVVLNEIVEFSTSAFLGTPQSSIDLIIDTGSSDLWVWGPNTGAPYTFDASKSSTSQYVNDGFEIAYVSGNAVHGDYYKDLFWFEGSEKSPVQFGVANNAYTSDHRPYGILGLSFRNIEGSKYGQYDNLVYCMRSSGVINQMAYSLFLSGPSSTYGTLLFGAVDLNKFSGSLTTLPLQDDHSFTVKCEVEGIAAQGNLDSGSSLIYLPDALITTVLSEKFPGMTYYDPIRGMYKLIGTNIPDTSVTFTFNDVDIEVGPESLWLQMSWNNFFFTICPSETIGGIHSIGDVLLRNAYVVYDLENRQVAIAPLKISDTENIQPIADNIIPGVAN